MTIIKGGCLCGAVHYGAEAEPAIVAVCHCRDCQKSTSSAFAFLIAVPETALKFHGARETFSSVADSRKPILRHFWNAARQPDHTPINGDTLDDSRSKRPSIEIYCDRELGWGAIGGYAALLQKARANVNEAPERTSSVSR